MQPTSSENFSAEVAPKHFSFQHKTQNDLKEMTPCWVLRSGIPSSCNKDFLLGSPAKRICDSLLSSEHVHRVKVLRGWIAGKIAPRIRESSSKLGFQPWNRQAHQRHTGECNRNNAALLRPWDRKLQSQR